MTTCHLLLDGLTTMVTTPMKYALKLYEHYIWEVQRIYEGIIDNGQAYSASRKGNWLWQVVCPTKINSEEKTILKTENGVKEDVIDNSLKRKVPNSISYVIYEFCHPIPRWSK